MTLAERFRQLANETDLRSMVAQVRMLIAAEEIAGTEADFDSLQAAINEIVVHEYLVNGDAEFAVRKIAEYLKFAALAFDMSREHHAE